MHSNIGVNNPLAAQWILVKFDVDQKMNMFETSKWRKRFEFDTNNPKQIKICLEGKWYTGKILSTGGKLLAKDNEIITLCAYVYYFKPTHNNPSVLHTR